MNKKQGIPRLKNLEEKKAINGIINGEEDADWGNCPGDKNKEVRKEHKKRGFIYTLMSNHFGKIATAIALTGVGCYYTGGWKALKPVAAQVARLTGIEKMAEKYGYGLTPDSVEVAIKDKKKLDGLEGLAGNYGMELDSNTLEGALKGNKKLGKLFAKAKKHGLELDEEFFKEYEKLKKEGKLGKGILAFYNQNTRYDINYTPGNESKDPEFKFVTKADEKTEAVDLGEHPNLSLYGNRLNLGEISWHILPRAKYTAKDRELFREGKLELALYKGCLWKLPESGTKQMVPLTDIELEKYWRYFTE